MMRYRVFDRVLDSDLDFPELPGARRSGQTIVLRHEASRSAHVAPAVVRWIHHVREADEAEPWLSVGRAGSEYIIDFPSIVSLRYHAGTIRWTPRGSATDDSLRHAILDQALPLIVAHEGQTVLHAACPIGAGQAVLLAGPAGAGKSTLLAHLLTRGWDAAADDAAVVALTGDGRVELRPSYGGLRLWPDSSAALQYGTGDTVAHYSEKRRFAARALPDDPLTLRGVFLLNADAAEAVPELLDVTRRDAVIALLRNTFVLDTEDVGRAAARLDVLGDIAARVPVRALRLPHRYDALAPAGELIDRAVRGVCA